jgi:hypothetical protein
MPTDPRYLNYALVYIDDKKKVEAKRLGRLYFKRTYIVDTFNPLTFA